MLLSLALWLQELHPDWGFLRVFQYLTFRSVMAAMTALVIGLLLGPYLIRKLTELKIGQPIRAYAMDTHLTKRGTPTMGGALILLAIGLSTLLWFDWANRFVWIVMIVTTVIGLIAAIYLAFSVSETNNLRVVELFFRWIGSGFSNDLPPKADLIVPFFKTVSYPLGVWGFMVLTYIVIVGTSNAVNLTDGLDGLAIMPVVMVSAPLGIFAYVT